MKESGHTIFDARSIKISGLLARFAAERLLMRKGGFRFELTPNPFWGKVEGTALRLSRFEFILKVTSIFGAISRPSLRNVRIISSQLAL